MISAEKCRIHATACKELASSVDIPTQRSLEQSIMALNWEALADQIDRENSQATEAAFRKHGISSAAFYKWMAKYGGPGCRNSCW